MTTAPRKGRFRVRVIRAGLSLNRNYYPDKVLREAVPLFQGARVFAKSDADHLAGKGKDVNNLIGRVVNPEFVAGPTPDSGAVYAELELIDPESAIGRKLIEAKARDMSDLFGLSIDAAGSVKAGHVNGQSARIATAITAVKSVDIIVEPGAGGCVLDLLEAVNDQQESHLMNREQLLALIQKNRPELLWYKDEKDVTDAELSRMVDTAMREAAPSAERAAMVDRVNRSSLPANAKARVIKELETAGTFTEAAVDRRIKEEIDYFAPVARGNHVSGLGDDPEYIRIVEGRDEKVNKMLDALFDPKDNRVVSIRECYLEITGDRGFTGRIQNCDKARLREALGSETFQEVLGNAVSRRMVADYQTASVYDVYKDLVRVIPVNDFREQQRVRYGGYGDLPMVMERDPYTELTSPTDEAAKYTAKKRGGLEILTLEMITNDDMSVVLDIPRRLSRAAKRTLAKFVLNHFKSNGVIYDGKPLFCVDHGNLGTDPLSSNGVANGRLAIKRQKEKDSEERLGIRPRFLWVPDELEQTAFNLFKRDTNIDADFIQSLQLEVRPVWDWDDANDWMLSADPTECPVMELGFLNGREDPELFIQDSPITGSLFHNDTVTLKIRHIYGGAIIDFRSVYKSVVPA